MQPMPQSICAIVCIYVYFGPTQRLLPGVDGASEDGNPEYRPREPGEPR